MLRKTLPLALVAMTLGGPLTALAAPTTEEKLDILSAEVERLRKEVGKQDGHQSSPGRTTVGGYGELHFNNLENQTTGAGSDTIDLHRFVLFFGHQFSDTVRLHSELEVEHAFVKDTQTGSTAPGEVEVEQAYVEVDLSPQVSAKGGLFLIPVGILNETHEPPTFYGVERNPIEKDIIPATWWEAGAALTGRTRNGWSTDLAVHSGLLVGNNFSIRSGRQKGASATANDSAYTGRIKWSGIPGIEWATTVQYQQDIGQGLVSNLGSAGLVESHVAVNRGPFGLRALYAQWKLHGDGPAAAGADKQYGYYVEPSLKITKALGIFTRYNQWDTVAHDATDSVRKQVDVGVNYWPHENVVIKADMQKQHNPTGIAEMDGFNLGVGYMF